MRVKKVFRSFGVVAAIGLLSVTALAVDGKRYIGSFCDFTYSTTGSSSRSYAKFQNLSGSTRQVACPVLQDVVDGDIEYAEIVMTSTIDEDTCRLFVRQGNGSSSYYTHSDVVSAGSGMNRTRWFPGSAWGNISSDAAMAIMCDLPNTGVVAHYRLDDR